MKSSNHLIHINSKSIGYIVALMVIITSSGHSANRYWDSSAGSGNWSDPVWSLTSGGTYNTNWSTSENTIIEGTATATISLTGNITPGDITFTGYNQTIAGANLNFSGGNILNEYTTGFANRRATITSGITGSPDIKQATNTAYQGLIFAPTTYSMTLGTIQCPSSSGSSDKAGIELNGAAGILNSVNTIEYYSGRKYGSVDFSGSGNWTVGNATIGIFDVNSGHVIVNGTVNTQYQHTRLYGGVFHYNNASAVATGKPIYQHGGSYDNTSGAPITSATNPTQGWYSDHTFIGSHGANSDLHMGTGTVTLYGNYTITVANAATTLTFGGIITDVANSYNISKDGPGVLKLEGVNTYNGSTNIISGNLELTQASLDDDATVYIQSGAKLDLSNGTTDTVFALYLGGVPAAAGTWGSTSSSATNKNDTYFSGTGILSNTGGLDDAGFLYWDGPNAGGTGDGVSDGGTGNWNTSTSNWDIGVTSRTAWNNSNSGNVFFKTTAGTVTLTEDITVGDIWFDEVGTYTIDGASYNLNFTTGSNITNDYYGSSTQNQTFNTGITGSPNVYMITNGSSDSGMIFNPTTNNMTLGTVTVAYKQGTNDKCAVRLNGGAGTVNTVEEIAMNYSTYSSVRFNGSGKWTLLGDAYVGRFRVQSGDVVINGMVRTRYFPLELESGGTLHYNYAGGSNTINKNFDFNGGSLDNTSGNAITTSITNPIMQWDANFTFIGSNGADSDLYMGTGAVSMGATRTITVSNEATTFGAGGVVSGAGGLVKAGSGTMRLRGDNTYTGTTTVSAGNLIVNGNHTGAGAYSVSAYAGFGGNGVISSAVTVSANGELRPGDGVGSLTLGAGLTLDGNSITRFNMDHGVGDNVIVTGALTLNGTLDISGNLQTGTFVAFTCTSGTITNNIHTITTPSERYSANIFISSNVATANIIALPAHGTTIRFR